MIQQIARAAIALVLLLSAGAPALAQGMERAGRPAPTLEVIAGYAGFVDESPVDHVVVGGAARVHLSPRVSIGPEVIYMRGPGEDRDVFLTGNLTFDFVSPDGRRPARVTPFVVAGGGLFRHTNRFGTQRFSHVEGAATGGGGVRVWFNERAYAAGDVRLGWELHYRVVGLVGIAL